MIAFNCGSVPEVIDHGVSGFIVENEDEAVDAVKRLHELPRAGVRARFDERFTSQQMARNYIASYEELLRRQHRTILREVAAG